MISSKFFLDKNKKAQKKLVDFKVSAGDDANEFVLGNIQFNIAKYFETIGTPLQAELENSVMPGTKVWFNISIAVQQDVLNFMYNADKEKVTNLLTGAISAGFNKPKTAMARKVSIF